MKLAIVGGRDFNNESLLHQAVLECMLQNGEISQIISGGARGADTLARKLSKDLEIPLIEHIPDWEAQGKKAGFIRNQLIVNDCDGLIAFWDGKSKGTKHSIDLAIKQNKLYKVVSY